MKIDVKQIKSEKSNNFEIYCNDKIQYRATLPFLSVRGFFDLDKIQEIKVFALNGEQIYTSFYDYLENKTEEFIPLKYLVTGSQKFNQIKFVNKKNNNEILIYDEAEAIWKSYYNIKVGGKGYLGYSVADGYFIHICIYDGDTQVAEFLKPQIVTNGNDEYRIYLKDNYNHLADALALFALYVDRNGYNSSYLKAQGQQLRYSKTYSKTNKFYNPNWVKINFDSIEYFESYEKKAQEIIDATKKQFKLVLKLIGISFAVMFLIVLVILYFIFR